jgi:hypothetical protein
VRKTRGRSNEDRRKTIIISKGNKELLARRGGGEVGNTGGVAFRGDAVGEPIPFLRARAVLQSDGNTHVTVGRTTGPMYEIGERPRSWTLIQLTLTDPVTEVLS